jgi:hypothetical protein
MQANSVLKLYKLTRNPDKAAELAHYCGIPLLLQTMEHSMQNLALHSRNFIKYLTLLGRLHSQSDQGISCTCGRYEGTFLLHSLGAHYFITSPGTFDIEATSCS